MKHFFIKTAIHLNKSTLGILLFLLPSAFLFTFVFARPEVVKQQLRESNLYTFVSDEIATSLVGAASGASMGISQETLRTAAKDALPPSDVQQKIESVLDDGYAWLYGKKKSFAPSVSFEGNKQKFLENIAKQTTSTIAAKPDCSYAQLQQLAGSGSGLTAASLAAASCKPSTIDTSSYAQQIEQMLGLAGSDSAPSQNFAIASSQDEAQNAQRQVQETPFEVSYKMTPPIFQFLTYSFYVFLILIACVLFVLKALLPRWYDLFGLLSRVLLLNGILLVMYGACSQWLLGQNGLFGLLGQQRGAVVQSALRPFAGVSIRTVFICGGVYIVLACVIYGVRRWYHEKHKQDEIIAIVTPNIQNNNPPAPSARPPIQPL